MSNFTQQHLHFWLLLLLIGLWSCQSGPKPIDYGNALCAHCKMTIADPKFGAELVTDKGKVYMFDATECMIAYMEEHNMTAASPYVIAYDQPGHLIPATSATFLLSPDQPSPMGAFLSAYKDAGKAKARATHPEAQLLKWEEVPNLLP